MRELSYYRVVRLVVRAFRDAQPEHDEPALTGAALGALWTALNHPQAGKMMRDKVSAALRPDGHVHIVWHFADATGLAIALADGFVDLADVSAKTHEANISSTPP